MKSKLFPPSHFQSKIQKIDKYIDLQHTDVAKTVALARRKMKEEAEKRAEEEKKVVQLRAKK